MILCGRLREGDGARLGDEKNMVAVVRTPLLKDASILSWSTPSGIWNDRSNEP
jgi:hypothetical protein